MVRTKKTRFIRTCKRCKQRYETIFKSGKVCKNCVRPNTVNLNQSYYSYSKRYNDKLMALKIVIDSKVK